MALPDSHRIDPSVDQEGGSEPLGTFGRYLLFKRLRRDGWGELYRAGQLGATAVQRIVSLRLFNSAEIDGGSFWRACEPRRELTSTLRGGPFGEVVDFGLEDGVPYVAHEYVFGRSLAELLAEARAKSYPVPLDHALYLMDRIALALRNAHEKRLEGKRILHGLVIPELVHLSSEGEVRLSGFETSAALLELDPSGPARASVAGYLSPEVNAGRPPRSSDDVYSLGALFAELLTGEPLPPLNPTESSRWVNAAELAEESAPLPDDVRHLLRESLLPREHRIQSAEHWLRALTEITNAGGYSPTTFNLAFFMHTLFGEELDLEVRLVEVEKLAEPPSAPVAAPAPPAPDADAPVTAQSATPPPADDEETVEVEAPLTARAAPPPPAGDEETVEIELPVTGEPEPEVELAAILEEPETDGFALDREPVPEAAPAVEPAPAPRPATSASKVQAAPGTDRRRVWLVGAAILVAALGAGGYFLFASSGSESTARSAAPMVTAPAPRPSSEPGAALEPAAEPPALDGIDSVAPPRTPEELQLQVRELVARRADVLEDELKAEYDQRLVELRQQLESARRAAAGSGGPPAPVDAPTDDAPAEPEPAAPERSQITAPITARRTAEKRTPAPQPPPAPAPDTAPDTVLDTSPEQASEPAPASAPDRAPDPTPAESQPAAPLAEQSAPAAVAPEAPASREARVTAPKLLNQPRVVYPPAAARLKREATVRVRILVDESGKPTEIEQLGKKVGLGFDQAALQAARTTRWTPGDKDGEPVSMWVELSIDFRR